MLRLVAMSIAFWMAAEQAMAAEQSIPVIGNQNLIVSPAAAESQPMSTTGRIRILERRRMGLTAANVVRILHEIKADGELSQYSKTGDDGIKEIDVSNLSLAVADRMATERPGDWQDIDWDKVLEYIEKILELLIKYLPIIFDLFA